MILTTTKKLERNLERASSYEEWKQAAQAYDAHTGLDRWKIMDQSRRYDYVSIRVRLDRLRALRARQDNRGLLFNLNEGIHGNMGGYTKRRNSAPSNSSSSMSTRSFRPWSTLPARKWTKSLSKRNSTSSTAPITVSAAAPS